MKTRTPATTATTRLAKLLATTRAVARRKFNRTGQPVSVNDVRHLLTRYDGDQRIAAQVFRRWTPVGYTDTTSPTSNASRVGAARSKIRTYVPTV